MLNALKYSSLKRPLSSLRLPLFSLTQIDECAKLNGKQTNSAVDLSADRSKSSLTPKLDSWVELHVPAPSVHTATARYSFTRTPPVECNYLDAASESGETLTARRAALDERRYWTSASTSAARERGRRRPDDATFTPNRRPTSDDARQCRCESTRRDLRRAMSATTTACRNTLTPSRPPAATAAAYFSLSRLSLFGSDARRRPVARPSRRLIGMRVVVVVGGRVVSRPQL